MDYNLQRLDLSRFVAANAYNVSGNLLSEAAQVNLSDAVLAKMFELTIGKYNKIDFTEIERSRGDVTKTKFYKNLDECINTLIDMHTVTDKIPSILIVSEAFNNLRSLKNTFEYNFRIKNSCAIMIYNTIYYSIMEATSYIIATSIDFVKDDGFAKVDVRELNSKNLCLLNSLNQFNKCVADNSLFKFIKETGKEDSVQTESVASDLLGFAASKLSPGTLSKAGKGVAIGAGVVAILWLGTHIIPLLREAIYWIYRARHKISETAALQAKFLEMNIESMEHSEPNAVMGKGMFGKKITSEKLITRQTKWMKAFQTIARKFALDSDKTDRDSKIDIKQDKVDVSNVVI